MKLQGFLFGATDVTRTHDLLITNQLLYQLSYSSIFHFEDALREYAMLTLTTTSDLLITNELLATVAYKRFSVLFA